MNKPEGFSYQQNGTFEVVIYHHGSIAARLRKDNAKKFLKFAESAEENALQLKMAKLTGNYKHGNERARKNRRQ